MSLKRGVEEPAVSAFLKSAVSLGFKRNEDYNAGESPEGVSPFQFNTERGRRVTSFQGYLYTGEYQEKKHRLHGLFNAQVIRIRFDKERKKAIGVEVLKTHEKCTKETWSKRGDMSLTSPCQVRQVRSRRRQGDNIERDREKEMSMRDTDRERERRRYRSR